MSRGLKQRAYWVGAAMMGAVLAGCAETTYPNLPTIPTVSDSLLTPTEQEKAIRDLSKDKVRGGEEADKTVGGR